MAEHDRPLEEDNKGQTQNNGVPLIEVVEVLEAGIGVVVKAPRATVAGLKAEMKTLDPTEHPLVAAAAERTIQRLFAAIANVPPQLADVPLVRVTARAISGGLAAMAVVKLAAEPEETIRMGELMQVGYENRKAGNDNRNVIPWYAVCESQAKLNDEPSGFSLVDDLAREVINPGSGFAHSPFEGETVDEYFQVGVFGGIRMFKAYILIGSKAGLGPKSPKQT